MQSFKIIVEKHTDGYIAYPIGLKGVVIGQGDTYKQEQTKSRILDPIDDHRRNA